MATNIEKFLNQAGVSTLWSRVAEEVAKVDQKVETNASDISTLKGRVEALEAGTYDDTEVRGLIAVNASEIESNASAIAVNTAALAVLNGNEEGSVNATVAAKIAEIVAGANESFDTLKEIADWILSDTTGAASMANDITALETLVGNKRVSTQIQEAIAAENLDKYALASNLNALADRVSLVEAAKHSHSNLALLETYTQTDADLANAVAKAHEHTNKAVLDGITSTKVAAWDAAETNANAYTDSVLPVAMTTEEIDAAIAAAKNQA